MHGTNTFSLKLCPADWHEDSSLATWFPLTSEELNNLRAATRTPDAGLVKALDKAPHIWVTIQSNGKPKIGTIEYGENEKYYSESVILEAIAAHKAAAHPDDVAVDAFATRMKEKLAKKRAEGRGGWEDKARCSAKFLSLLLREHVQKGDPVDVANFCMFLFNRGENINPLAAPDVTAHEMPDDYIGVWNGCDTDRRVLHEETEGVTHSIFNSHFENSEAEDKK